MNTVVATKKYGDIKVELNAGETLAELVDQVGEAAVYYAATGGRSLADIVSGFVRGQVSGRSTTSLEDIIAAASKLTLEPPLSKAALKAQRILEDLADSDDTTLAAAIQNLTPEQRERLLASAVS